MTARWMATGLTLMLLAGPAYADDPWTLESALTRAAAVSTAIQLQALSSEAAEARWLADPRAGAPSIRVGLRDLDARTATEPVPRDPEIVTRLRVPFPRPWDLATAAEQGKATVAREDAELDAIRADVQGAVIESFHALPLLRDALASAERLATLRGDHVQLVDQRRAEGLATALDWLDAEEARRDADDRRAGRAAELEAVEADLRTLLQLPESGAIDVVPEDVATAAQLPLPTLESLIDGAAARDPGVHEAQSEIRRAEARLRRQRLDALPWLDWAQAGASFKAQSPVAFEVGVAVDVPVYLWSSARTRAASQEVSGARLRLQEAELSTGRRLARRLRSAAAARERWVVEGDHLAAITAQAEPLMELADPAVQLELRARLVRAELRTLTALIELVRELDRLHAAAHR